MQAEEALMVLEPDDEDEVVVESGPADADVVMVGEEVAKPSLDTVVTHLAAVQSHLLGIEEALAELGARGVNEHFADTQNSARRLTQLFSRERHVFLTARRGVQQGLCAFMTAPRPVLPPSKHRQTVRRAVRHWKAKRVWVLEDGGRAVWGM